MTSPSKSVFDLALETKNHLQDQDIQELAYLCLTTDKINVRAGEIYLRTLINRTKEHLSEFIMPLIALDRAEAPMYEAVKRGSLTTDIQYNPMSDSAETRSIKAKEHNRRCNWARSIKSELKSAIRAGADINAIDVDTIRKSDLRELKKEAIEAAISDGKAVRPDSVSVAVLMLSKVDKLLIEAQSNGLDVSPALKLMDEIASKYK